MIVSRLYSVQALRAVAALAVLAGHLAQNEIRFLDAPLLPAWLQAGASGVDLFFVISGFVMVYVTRGMGRAAPAQSARFLYQRAARIYPAYWLFTGLVLIGYLLMPGSLTRGLDELNLLASLTLWPVSSPPVLLVAWTLIHELYFYLVFAGLLLLPGRLFVPALSVWIAAILAAHWSGLAYSGAVAGLAFHPLTLEFIAGCAIGLLVCSGRRRFGAASLVAGLALWAGSFAWLAPAGPADIPMGWLRVGIWGVPAVLTTYGVVTLEIDHRMRTPGPLVALGDWSYALYLAHLPVVALLVRLVDRFVPETGPLPNLIFIATASLASIAVAGLTYRLFERPVLALTRKWGDRVFPAAPFLREPPIAARIW